MGQEKDETIKQYLKRFMDQSTPLEREHTSLCVEAFKISLWAGPFNNNMTRRSARTMDEICHGATGYIKEEDDDMRKMRRHGEGSKEER